MKKLSILSAIFGLAFIGTAGAANITIYHSPTCPHCHHARDFFKTSLIYEYPNLQITEVNVMEPANQEKFSEQLKKCEYSSGGVPVIIVGEKCFQGYADSMQDELREAVEVDLPDSEKTAASENRQALADNADAFKEAHADRLNAITEDTSALDAEKKNEVAEADQNTETAAAADATPAHHSSIYFYLVLAALVLILGAVVVKRKK